MKHLKQSYICRRLVLFAGILLVNLCLDLRSYHNYQDKMHILGRMFSAGSETVLSADSETMFSAGSGTVLSADSETMFSAGSEAVLSADSGTIFSADSETMLDAAAELLKSKDTDSGAGQQFLERYGYTDSRRNRYYAGFLKECIITAAGSAGLFLLFLAMAWLQERRLKAAQEAYFAQLGECLLKFREGEENVRQFPLPSLEGSEESVSRVNDQLELLFEYLSLMREQAYREKEGTKSLVTDISHQLKTPMAALDTCFAVLENPALSEEERLEFYGRCRSELDGLKALLDSLIQISRMEAGLIQIERNAALVLDTIVTAVNRIYPKASDKQIELAFDYAPETERLFVMQDEKWLCEALMNILDNAVKYSPNGSEIQISVQRRSSFVRIEIADHGIGIPKQEYHKVFKRFFRGSSRLVRGESGTGVGLYLVREIIEKHHGMVFVKSDYGRKKEYPGSRFVIRLPIEA